MMLILIQLLIIIILVLIALTLVLDEKKQRIRKRHLVKIKSFWDGANRRAVVRHSACLDVHYNIKSAIKPGRSCDISTHGIGLVLDEKLSKGTLLDINVKPEGSQHTIQAKAKVMWTKESPEDEKDTDQRLFYTGIKFIRFDSKKHEDNLFEYIGSLAGNDPSSKYI